MSNAEIKSGFGALIVRFMHSLRPEQELVPWLKAPAVTHLVFSSGALGSTGDASEEQARLSIHELRMVLYHTLGVRTNFRRFAVSNMVCSSSLGYNVDLARMYAENRTAAKFVPELFPGLFWTHPYRFKRRRKVELMEDDLVHLHRAENCAARHESDQAIRDQIRDSGMREAYLPQEKNLMVLVFAGGALVGLGMQGSEAATEAFQAVAAVAHRYRIEDAHMAELMKRRRASDRLADKNRRVSETYGDAAPKLSVRTALGLQLIVNTVEDDSERKLQIRQLLQEETRRRRKRRRPGTDEPLLEAGPEPSRFESMFDPFAPREPHE